MKPSERMQQLYAEELKRVVTAHDGDGRPRFRVEAELREQLHIVAITRYLDEQHELRKHASEGAIAAAEQARASDTERPLPVDGGQYLAWLAGEGPDPCPPCNCDQAQRLERENARLRALLDRARELLWVADYQDRDRDRQRLALLRDIREAQA